MNAIKEIKRVPRDATPLASVERSYTGLISKKIVSLLILTALIVLFVSIATTIGVMSFSLREVSAVILNKVFPKSFSPTAVADRVVWNIRLPRILFGLLAGMGLGTAGGVMQVVLKNPLASPYTLGISSAAGFGAALAIISGRGLFGNSLIAGNAFVFSLLSSLLIVGIAKRKGTTPQVMILSGITIMYFFSACTTLLQYFADPEAVKGVVFWMVGSLGKATWDKVGLLAGLLAVCLPLLIWKSWDFNIISSGDETAKGLGIDVEKLRSLAMIVASLLVAGIVAFSGTIGFIGLIAPHVARGMLGGDNKFVLPCSALLGGLLLAGADTVAQNIMPPVILPIGVITAFMGIPLFAYLIMRRKSGAW